MIRHFIVMCFILLWIFIKPFLGDFLLEKILNKILDFWVLTSSKQLNYKHDSYMIPGINYVCLTLTWNEKKKKLVNSNLFEEF